MDEFQTAANVRITEVADGSGQGKTVVGILKRAIERTLLSDTGFTLSTTAALSLSGTIRELTITDRRTDANGRPLERLVQIRVDFAVLDEGTGRDIVERKNFIRELNYYTDTYSLELGMTDREAIEEKLLVELAEAIHAVLDRERDRLPVTAPAAPREKVELSDEEKALLGGVGPPVPRRKYLSWNLNFEDEIINIPEGTLAAAGQNKFTTNRFTQTTTMKLEPIRWDNSEVKGVAIGKYEPREIRALSLQRGELEYLVNPNNLFKFGTVSATLNKYVFDQTLAGASYDGKYEFGGMKHNLLVIGGRDFRANGLGDLPRYSVGGAWEAAFKDIVKVRFLADAARDQDPTVAAGVRTQVDNQIYGISGSAKAPWKHSTELKFDLDRSYHKEIRLPDTTYNRGDLLDLRLTQKYHDLTLEGVYTYVDENFRTIYGSATSDREKLGVTANLPGKVKWIDYTWRGEATRSNRVANRTSVDVLLTSGLNLVSKPFATWKSPYLNKSVFTTDYSLRRTYDDIKVVGTAPSNNRENFKASFNVKNTLWDIYTTSFTWDDERERDKLRFELQTIQELRWDNTVSKSINDFLKVELKGNYRSRDGGVQQDRFSTFGGSLSYEKDAFTGRFDYLRDLKRGTLQSQDSTKDRFTLDLSYTNERAEFKNTLTARGDYEINDFAITANNHHRWTTLLGLKVIF
ncbi:MAG: hypothetical protein AAB229_01020 [Candidatus Hydrogenedentota bacterium]